MNINKIPILICQECNHEILSGISVKKAKRDGCPKCGCNKFKVNIDGIYIISSEIEKVFSIYTSCKNCQYSEYVKLGNTNKTNCGCCSNCAKMNGFFNLDTRYNSQLELLKVLYKFDPVYGFFDINLPGCRLPIHAKSKVCVEFICYDLFMEMNYNENTCYHIIDYSFIVLGSKKLDLLKKELDIIN
jgi:hypothetical protein